MVKRIVIIAAFLAGSLGNKAFSQDIKQAQVPSVIVNHFQKNYPKAYDIEWERDGENYKVEFETGTFGYDHELWYDKTGKVIRHKEEIPKSGLPATVISKIEKEYNGYRIDDIDKITENSKVTYLVELKKWGSEWKVLFDKEGKILSKMYE